MKSILKQQRIIFVLLFIIISGYRFALLSNTFHKKSEIKHVIDSLNSLCWELRELKSDSALTIGKKALKLAQEHELQEEIVTSSNYIGVIYSYYLYRYRDAIPYYHNALELGLITKDSMEIAYAYNNLSHVYLQIGNAVLANNYGNLSLKMFKELNDAKGLAYAYTNLASVSRFKKNFDQSLEYLNKVASIRDSLNPKRTKRFALYRVGQTYEKAGVYDSAIIYYNAALNQTDMLHSSKFSSDCLNGIGNVYVHQGRYQEALEFYKKSMKWNSYRKHYFGIVENYIGLAKAYAHLNRRDEGVKMIDEAFKLSKTPKLETQLINVYKAEIEFYRILNDYEQASLVFDRYTEASDSILYAHQIDIVKELEKNFNTSNDLQKANQELEFNRKFRMWLTFFMSVLLIVLIVLYRQFKLRIEVNKRLRESNETKNKLFSVISHDLRNPFNALIGFGELISTKLKQKEYNKAEHFSEILVASAKEGKDLLTNLLNWSMSQSGRFSHQPKSVSLIPLFNKIDKHFEPYIKSNSVSLVIHNNVNNEVNADCDLLQIILLNLITNSFKFTPDGGEIRVDADLLNGKLIIKVSDTGQGMDGDLVRQLSASKNHINSKQGVRNEKGAGLGLSIVKDLLKVQNGTLKIDSKIGEGTCFKIGIPV